MKQRSSAQNRSLHKFCQELSQELNHSGISQTVFYRNIEADFTPENIKELFRSFARTKFNKNSTADLTTSEMVECYEEVNRHVSQFGIEISWPSHETLSLAEYYNEKES